MKLIIAQYREMKSKQCNKSHEISCCSGDLKIRLIIEKLNVQNEDRMREMEAKIEKMEASYQELDTKKTVYEIFNINKMDFTDDEN